jgi:hypothetical protein
VLADFDDSPLAVLGGDLLALREEVDAVDRLVVLAHVVVALGAAGVVVEGDARAEDVDDRRARVRDRGLDQRHELALVAGEAARDEGRAHLQRQATPGRSACRC